MLSGARLLPLALMCRAQVPLRVVAGSLVLRIVYSPGLARHRKSLSVSYFYQVSLAEGLRPLTCALLWPLEAPILLRHLALEASIYLRS